MARRAGVLRQAGRRAGWGLYLGQGAGGPAWATPQRSTLVLGPSRSGKTSSLVIPNILVADGPVVTTSTKPDVLQATAPARATAGTVLLFDPSGTVTAPPGVAPIGWSPITSSCRWDGALLTADAMVRTATGMAGRSPSESHWSERATALLAPLLHAAGCDGAGMATVLTWVDRHQGDDALRILGERSGAGRAADLLAGILTTDQREQSGIWSTASGVLAAYRSDAALASTAGEVLNADAFCAGAHTLYLCAPSQHQQLLAPLMVGVLRDIRDAAYERARRTPGGPPVLWALDEAANIAPLPDLPAVVSEGAGQGVLTLACLQDLSQARARWGHAGDAFVSLFGTTVVLPGIADMPTLGALSRLAGEWEVPVRSVTAQKARARAPVRSVSLHTVWRPRLPVEAIAGGVEGCALAVDERTAMGWVRLTPAHASTPFRELTAPRSLDRPLPSLPAGDRGRWR